MSEARTTKHPPKFVGGEDDTDETKILVLQQKREFDISLEDPIKANPEKSGDAKPKGLKIG